VLFTIFSLLALSVTARRGPTGQAER